MFLITFSKKMNFDPEKISISDLVDKLNYYNQMYYTLEGSPLTDIEFDILVDVLQRRDPKNRWFKNKMSKILPYQMNSLNKIKYEKDEKIFNRWFDPNKEYLNTDKLDGISCLLYKNNNTLTLFKKTDKDDPSIITKFFQYIDFHNADFDAIPNGIGIRAELIISIKNRKNITDYDGATRNVVTALTNVNTNKFNEKYDQIIEFVAYSVYKVGKRNLENDYKYLESLGFKTPYRSFIKNLTFEKLNDYLNERRIKSEYPIDGVVVTENEYEFIDDIDNPKYSYAFKNINDVVETTVKEIIWKKGLHKYLNPVAVLDPVKMYTSDGGFIVVRNASAHNASFVVENGLGPGAIVNIIRSGDVIPYIFSTTKKVEPQLPDVDYYWTSTKKQIVSNEPHDRIDDIEIITHFFKTMGVKGISKSTVEKIYDFGYTSVSDILNVDKTLLYNISGLGVKSIDKIFDGLYNSLELCNLSKFMDASGIFDRGLGEKKIESILKEYPDILEWENKSDIYNAIIKIPGFSIVSTEKFIKGINPFLLFRTESNYDRWCSNEKITDIRNQEILENTMQILDQDTSSPLFGKIIVFTKMRAKGELLDKIKKLGGIVADDVTQKTDIVVYKDGSGETNSVKKGIKYGAKIYSFTEFNDYYLH